MVVLVFKFCVVFLFFGVFFFYKSRLFNQIMVYLQRCVCLSFHILGKRWSGVIGE